MRPARQLPGRRPRQAATDKPQAARKRDGGFLMETSAMFLDCPGYMDQRGVPRCGLPAVVEDRYAMTSTDGPQESARIRCPRGHYFNGPLESFAWAEAAWAAQRT